jgi:hypothetical protein
MQEVAREAIVTMTSEPLADRKLSTFDFGEPVAGRVRQLLMDGFGER